MRRTLALVVVPLALLLTLTVAAQDEGMSGTGGRTADRPLFEVDADTKPPSREGLMFFESKIRPVLVEYCYDCHSADARRVRGDLTLDTAEGMRRGGSFGPAVVPGEPVPSLIIQALKHDDDLAMPPGERLSADIVADFERWIEMGAPDPRGIDEAAAETPDVEVDIEAGRDFWSFKPPVGMPAPDVEDEDWPLDDVDRFVLATMEGQGLEPVGDADRTTLIRRLTFDLTGLPPTPEQVEAFSRDRSEGALERLIDRLLDSPQFGERWGRHWLDVARYAESSGKENNVVYPHAWRYRDYVIDAFNADKRFDEFLTEQLAGDLLPADTADEEAEHRIATGYLAIGSKSHNTPNRAQFVVDVIDEQIDTMSQGMLGLTVACARCHDHKYDPIPTHDYYAMAGIFLSTETCFGTADSQGNRRSAPLLELPEDAEIEPGPSMPPAIHRALIERRSRAEDDRERLMEQLQGMSRNERRGSQAAAQLRRARGRLATLEELLGRYDDSGRPNENARVAMGVREAPVTRDARVLVRGELDRAADLVPRGFLQVLDDESTPTIAFGTSGRLQLAEWVASPDNPLTARVWVNRVWLHLFGAGIVPTPDNFGFSGQPPTHPDLLDHLAVTFVRDGWSTKRLVRRLVLSRTYRLGSYHSPRNYKIDPDNTWRWRMTRRRMEAESIRDAMLAAAGTLDLERPSGSPVAFTEGLARGLQRLGRLSEGRANVRSVYLPVLRDQVPEALDVFDFAEPSFVTGAREVTNIPSQALYLLNSETVMAHATAMADRILRMEGRDVERVRYAFALAFGREPSPAELRAVKAFFSSFPASQRIDAPDELPRPRRPARGNRRGGRRRGGDPVAGTSGGDPRRTAWAAFCQSLFASAEFRYLN